MVDLSWCVGRLFEMKDGRRLQVVGIVGSYVEIVEPPFRFVKSVPRVWFSEQLRDAREVLPSWSAGSWGG